MRKEIVVLSCAAMFAVTITSAMAQEAATPAKSDATAPAQRAPREKQAPQDLEPAVNTSAMEPAHVDPRPQDLEPAVDTSAPPAAAPETAARVSPKRVGADAARPDPGAVRKTAGKASDRLELDATQITGNRELPKVLYIVPWKRSDLSDLTGRPVNSLLDEVLTPVDRDVFKRENRYYRALTPDASQAPAAAAAPARPAAPPSSAADPAARDER